MRRILSKVVRNYYLFYENGKTKRKYMIVNGNLHGNEYGYYENGKIRYKYILVNDKLHSEYWYYGNGKLESKYTYIDGILVEKPTCSVL